MHVENQEVSNTHTHKHIKTHCAQLTAYKKSLQLSNIN